MDIEKINKSKNKYESIVFELLRKFEKENGVKIEAVNINEPHYLDCIKSDHYEIEIKIRNPFE